MDMSMNSPLFRLNMPLNPPLFRLNMPMNPPLFKLNMPMNPPLFRLNMPHDDDEKCKEFQKTNSTYVMSRTLDHNSNPWQWSLCSRHYLTTFLE